MNELLTGKICFLLLLTIYHGHAQLPPRLQIPGAILAGGRTAPQPLRPSQNIPPARLRRPNAIPLPVREIRPVIEENEEPNYPQIAPAPAVSQSSSAFDDEVNKLGLSALQSAIRNAGQDEDDRPAPAFRPERPIPIAREQIREKATRPQPSLPPPQPTRSLIRDDLQPVRQAPIRQATRPAPIAQQPQQTYRAVPTKVNRQQQQNYDDDEDYRNKRRKPVAQILKKYRTDNEDGSITWGFENDDGTFKEETLGADCINRGKYGYVDPDGVKREFTYETGNKCDQPEEDEDLLPAHKPNIPQLKNRPSSSLQSYRPAGQVQYVN